ncbi:MAG: 50S ribosomal protein L11 methyltransferase [Desulfuromonadaceae bacterium]|nr:50S ribosomal protein L11 methyltransferase [Desulfuromonadaceae bacterium]
MIDLWLEIACDVPEEYADVVAEFMTRLTGNGVCIDNKCVDAFSISEIPHSVRVVIKAYLSADNDPEPQMQELEAFISELSKRHPVACFGAPALTVVNSEDWSSSWKVHFKPLRIGKRLLIVPTWEEAMQLPGDLVLRIDPGMAFGTGGHETTRLCLELLEQTMDQCDQTSQPSLLDLGTGSGILAMAASLLGAGRILALDIDPDAVTVAHENLELNGLSERIECGTAPLESLVENFDIILANILAEELVRLAPYLTARLSPGGYLILSGILAEKEQLVRQGFASQPLNYCQTVCSGEWVAMQYRNEAGS